MPVSLSHRPFAEPFEQRLMALNADKKTKRTVVTRIHPGVIVHRSSKETAQREPDRALVDVSQPQPESEPEPVAGKKKRSPEAIAKQKATLAKKRRSNGVTRRTGEKSDFVRANPGIPAPQLVKLAKKQGLKVTTSLVYQVRSVEKKSATTRAPKTQQVSDGPDHIDASITDLLQAIITATSEIARRLSQLTL